MAVMQRRGLQWLAGWLLALAGGLLPATVLADDLELALESGALINVERIGSGDNRLLWLPSEFGLHAGVERQLARALVAEDIEGGVEVWLVDLHTSYFLPPGRNSLNEVSREDIRDLIDEAVPERGRLYLFSYGRGAALTLEAARLWQLEATADAPPLGGALLMHPNLMAGTARAGEAAEFLPIASATNLPLFVFQPLNSGKRWYLQELMGQLQQGGSDLFFRTLPGVSDGFQVSDDATEYELQVRAELPQMLRTAIRLLTPYSGERREAVAELPELAEQHSAQRRGPTIGLQPIPDTPPAPALQLTDIEGEAWTLEALRGQVVLINFWATWCPPCVEEIPSLGRLDTMVNDEGFRLLSVDVGQEAAEVRAFLERVPADYPVLLDPRGSVTGPWKIRAFPTTYLIDRQGRLRYGYFGGLEWDTRETVELIHTLLAE